MNSNFQLGRRLIEGTTKFVVSLQWSIDFLMRRELHFATVQCCLIAFVQIGVAFFVLSFVFVFFRSHSRLTEIDSTAASIV